MKNNITKTIDIISGNVEEKRQEILAYFEKTWAVDEQLYSQLKSDDIFYHKGDSLRHILLFYLGHTAVFYINKLMLAKIIDQRVNKEFESIFAIGVDEMSWDDLDEAHYNWPSVDEVREYRRQVKQVVMETILRIPIQMPIQWEDPMWLILMGIEHERIHLETSSVLIRQLPLDEVVKGKFGAICKDANTTPVNSFLPVAGKTLQLGRPQNYPVYGWDNEYGKSTAKVEDFKASKYLVSNEEFLEFVNIGGYGVKEYWTEEGWNWRNFKQATTPLFWTLKEDKYYLRLVAEEIEMPWNWPVEVNQLEAKAFCNWKSSAEKKHYRLPTEAEWYCLLQENPIEDELEWEIAPGNINLEHYCSPCPVDKFKMGNFYDLIGNVWQWTETPITGYAGFKVHPLYDDFTTPTFDGKHNIMKGGSWISTGNEATRHARYAFRRHFYQHAGFRMVESDSELKIETDEYETDLEIANSCEVNWSNSEDNFYRNLSKHCLKYLQTDKKLKILDLNTDTGRLAFELNASLPSIEKITAVDISARFIRLPIQLQEKGFMRYIIKDEGELVLYREIVLEETGLNKCSDKIEFLQADANNLKPIFNGYDVIIIPNLLEELICPIIFLQNIHERLNAEGMLFITSTYAWDKNKVERKHWLGGFKQDGEPVSSFDGMKSILQKQFKLVDSPIDIPLSIRKSSRIANLRISEFSAWRKK